MKRRLSSRAYERGADSPNKKAPSKRVDDDEGRSHHKASQVLQALRPEFSSHGAAQSLIDRSGRSKPPLSSALVATIVEAANLRMRTEEIGRGVG